LLCTLLSLRSAASFFFGKYSLTFFLSLLALTFVSISAEEEEAARRDEIRRERQREIERDLRMNNMGAEQRSKLQRRCVLCAQISNAGAPSAL